MEVTDEQSEDQLVAQQRIRFGLRPPHNVKAHWGARWIYPDDIVWDRAQFEGDVEEAKKLETWLEGTIDNSPLRKARAKARELASHRPSKLQQYTVLYEDEVGIIAGDPRNSGGYLYVGAYLKWTVRDGDRVRYVAYGEGKVTGRVNYVWVNGIAQVRRDGGGLDTMNVKDLTVIEEVAE